MILDEFVKENPNLHGENSKAILQILKAVEKHQQMYT